MEYDSETRNDCQQPDTPALSLRLDPEMTGSKPMQSSPNAPTENALEQAQNFSPSLVQFLKKVNEAKREKKFLQIPVLVSEYFEPILSELGLTQEVLESLTLEPDSDDLLTQVQTTETVATTSMSSDDLTPVDRIHLKIPGTWSQRALDLGEDADWKDICKTPDHVEIRPARQYHLTVDTFAQDGDLAGLSVLQDVDPFTDLTLLECDKITDDGLRSIGKLLSLITLTLAGCEQITDKTLKRVSSLSQLESLDLEGCSAISNAGLVHVGNLTGLRFLSLANCSEITGDGLQHLCELPELLALSLEGCTRITDNDLRHVEQMKELQALVLDGCTRITDDGLVCLSGLKNLQALDLVGCTHVTGGGVQWLKEALPQCRISHA